ncbi:hypothetical protein EBZ80_01070 [bacterium]|nr:hypothetical protein [bacterium]
MSTFLVQGIPQTQIFQSYSTGAKASATNFKIAGTDLNQIFAPYVSPNPQASATGYRVGATDLNQISIP